MFVENLQRIVCISNGTCDWCLHFLTAKKEFRIYGQDDELCGFSEQY
jgi:hypothetical protein